jgi:ATP adenylyltransferase
MERLWNPWRMAYIESARDHDPSDPGACVFCDILSQGDDEKVFILTRTDHAFAVMNIYPYNPGHLLIAPQRHAASMEDLDAAELAETSALQQQALSVLREEMAPDGFNIGMNLGRVAGAGIPGHVHWHVVPRWNGDSNFMSVTGETRMLPEALGNTYSKLRARFA